MNKSVALAPNFFEEKVDENRKLKICQVEKSLRRNHQTTHKLEQTHFALPSLQTSSSFSSKTVAPNHNCSKFIVVSVSKVYRNNTGSATRARVVPSIVSVRSLGHACEGK